MPRKLSEEQIRKQLIDPQLERAGWYLRDHSKVKIKVPVGAPSRRFESHRDGMI